MSKVSYLIAGLVGLTVLCPQNPADTVYAQSTPISVVNAGVPGENSGEGRVRFLHDVVVRCPNYVLIYFGMNDAVNEPKFLTQQQFVANMDWMVEVARKHHIVPILSTIQHVDAERLIERHKKSAFGVEGPNRKIDRYNLALRQLVLKKKIAISDFVLALDDIGGPTPSISTDGVHLTADGYRLLASTFLHAIPSHLHQGDLIVCIGDSLTYGVSLHTPDHDSDQTYPAQLERMANESVK